MKSYQTQVGEVEEAEYGVIPANPVFEVQDITNLQPTYNPQNEPSQRKRADRQRERDTRVGFEAGISLDGELAVGSTWDNKLRQVLFSAWAQTATRERTVSQNPITAIAANAITVLAGANSAANSGSFVPGHLVRTTGFASNNGLRRAGAGTTATNVALTGGVVETAPIGARMKAVGFEGAAGDIVTTATGLQSTVLDFTTLGLSIGEFLPIGGTTAGTSYPTAANNAVVEITGFTANTVSFVTPTGWAPGEGAGLTIRCWLSDNIRNGLTPRSVAHELKLTGLSPVAYQVIPGSMLNALALTIPTKGRITWRAEYMSRNRTTSTARTENATDYAPPLRASMTAANSVKRVMEGGVRLAGKHAITGMTLSISNSLSRYEGVGEEGSTGMGDEAIRVTGTINGYFRSLAMLLKIEQDVPTSLMVRYVDPAKDASYIMSLPYVTLSGGDPGYGQTDVTLNPNYSATRHPVLNHTIQWQRFEYLEYVA